jgi:hypothetical protein
MPNTKGMETWTSKSASFINTGRGGHARWNYVRVCEIQDKTGVQFGHLKGSRSPHSGINNFREAKHRSNFCSIL